MAFFTLKFSKFEIIIDSHAIIRINTETLCTLHLEVVLIAQSCPALCDPMDYSPSGSSVCGILQAGILQWVHIPFFRVSS